LSTSQGFEVVYPTTTLSLAIETSLVSLDPCLPQFYHSLKWDSLESIVQM